MRASVSAASSGNQHSERLNGRHESVPLVDRIDTPTEASYYRVGGIVLYVLGQFIAQSRQTVAVEEMRTPGQPLLKGLICRHA
jgi:hypothetical protein